MDSYARSHTRSRATATRTAMAAFSGDNFKKQKPPMFPPSYDAVYAVSSKCGTTPLAPRPEDYTEIFGGFRSSSSSGAWSIPVLDLPAVSDVDCVTSVFDYPEIFAGFHDVDFAVPFDELFQPFDPVADDCSSDEAWTPVGTESLSDDSDPFASSEKSLCFSQEDSHQSLDSKKFSVSYHTVNSGASSCIPNATHVEAVHGYTCVVDGTTSPREMKTEKGRSIVADDIVFSMDSSSATLQKHKSSTMSGKNSFDAGSVDGSTSMSHANLKYAFLSGTNLQTESQLPPSSGPPPVLTEQKGDIKRSSTSLKPPSNGYSSKVAVDSKLPPCFDLEVNSNSSAAVSVAAMKDAMDKAQAKLKAAKVFLDRKKDGLQSNTREDVNGSDNITSVLDCADGNNIVHESGPSDVNSFFKDMPTTSASQSLPTERKHGKKCSLLKDTVYSVEDGEWDEATWYNDKSRFAAPGPSNDGGHVSVCKPYNDDGDEQSSNSAEEACLPEGNRRKLKGTTAVSRQEYHDRLMRVAQHVHESDICECEKPDPRLTGQSSEGRIKEFPERKEEGRMGVFYERVECEGKLQENIAKQRKQSKHDVAREKKEHERWEMDGSNSKELFKDDLGGEELQTDCGSLEKGKTKELKKAEDNNSKPENENYFQVADDCRGSGGNLEGDSLLEWHSKCEETSRGEIRIQRRSECLQFSSGDMADQGLKQDNNEVKLETVTEQKENGKKLMQVSEIEEAVDIQEKNSYAENEETVSSAKDEWDVDDHGSGRSFEIELLIENGHLNPSDGAYNCENIAEVNPKSLTSESAKPVDSTDAQMAAIDNENERAVHVQDSSDMNIIRNESGGVCGYSGLRFQDEDKKVAQSVGDLKFDRDEKVKSIPTDGNNVQKEDTTQQKKGMPIDHKRSYEVKTKGKETNTEEEEQARKLEEEREREREREKDRMAVEIAIREARQRAYTDARDRAERSTFERASDEARQRASDEARQRAMAEARERLEKACAEARERSSADKSSDARLRAERAAVERATAEARQRAFERAMAERATLEARERIQRSISEKFTSEQDVITRQSSMPTMHSVKPEAADGESAQRCRARLERHRRTVERVAKALAEKNMRDLMAQREQAERSRLAETLDADIKRWSNGKEGNLRALLSTLQYILAPDSGWQPIPLTEVITAAAVKKAYRKATLCVHPDKLQQRGASIQQKYICEKVFDLLKDAWNKFNSEEK